MKHLGAPPADDTGNAHGWMVGREVIGEIGLPGDRSDHVYLQACRRKSERNGAGK
jgi:hypothetical protein